MDIIFFYYPVYRRNCNTIRISVEFNKPNNFIAAKPRRDAVIKLK